MPYQKFKNGRGGLIQAVVAVVIGLVILSMLGINIRKVMDSETTKENLSYAWDKVTYVWNEHLEGPATYVWREGFIRWVWDPIRNNIEERSANATSTAP